MTMIYCFGTFQLDTDRLELRDGDTLQHLEPQVFGVLAYLIEQRERVVPKEELLDRVWGHRFVGDATLSSRIMAARKAIGDSGREQRLIRTAHGRGFRFVGAVEAQVALAPDRSEAACPPRVSGTARETDGSIVADHGTVRAVGREAELRHLHAWLANARRGARQVVFVTGEAGRGKTTLVEAFLAEARADGAPLIGRGQCVQHQGEGEPYLPILDALSRLCRGPAGSDLVRLLLERAPTWMVQLPWLVPADDLDALDRRTRDATGTRMLREMAEALDVLTAERPLILVLEDLHWSDYSTLDLLALIARRQEVARLLVIGTYRPGEVGASRSGGHPLRTLAHDLRIHGSCTELALASLDESAVAEYLGERLGPLLDGARVTPELTALVHRRTEGNPLFMRSLVDWWLADGRFAPAGPTVVAPSHVAELAAGVPETVRELIEHQTAQLTSQEQAILEAASVSGVEFAGAALAVAVGISEEDVESACTELSRHGRFLEPRDAVEWRDGTLTGRYAFVHGLYQEVLYERLPVARRARIHREIAARLEAGYGADAPGHAVEIAAHFLRGRDTTRAVEYLRLAAEHALRRSAHREAIDHLNNALQILRRLPDTPERRQRELHVQSALGPALIPVSGWAAPDVEAAFVRARDLCHLLGETPALVGVLYGLATLHEYRGEFHTSQELIEERLRLLDPSGDPSLLVESHELLACSLFHQGAFTATLDHTRAALTLYDQARHRTVASLYGKDAGVACHAWAAQALCLLGEEDVGVQRIEDALALAERLEHLYSIASARSQAAFVYQYRQEPAQALRWANATIALATDQGFRYRVATGTILRGWALTRLGHHQEGIAELRRGLAIYQDTGAQMERPYYLALLAEAMGAAGQPVEGLAAIDEGLALISPGRSFFYEAELHRLRGTLVLEAANHASSLPRSSHRQAGLASDLSSRPPGREGTLADAEAHVVRALEVARRQQARTLERRASESLATISQRRGPDLSNRGHS